MKKKFLSLMIMVLSIGMMVVPNIAKADDNGSIFDLTDIHQYKVLVIEDGLYLYSKPDVTSAKVSTTAVPVDTVLTVTKEHVADNEDYADMVYVTYNGVSGWTYLDGCNDSNTVCSKVAAQYNTTIYVQKNYSVYSREQMVKYRGSMTEDVKPIGTLEKNKEYKVYYEASNPLSEGAYLYVKTDTLEGWIVENTFEGSDSPYDVDLDQIKEDESYYVTLAQDFSYIYSDIDKTKSYNVDFKKGTKLKYKYYHYVVSEYSEDEESTLTEYYYVKLSDGTSGWIIGDSTLFIQTDDGEGAINETVIATNDEENSAVEQTESQEKSTNILMDNLYYYIGAGVLFVVLVVIIVVIVVNNKKKKNTKNENDLPKENISTNKETTSVGSNQVNQNTENNEQPKE